MKRALKKTIFKKGGCSLPYWTGGEGEGPPLVLLHGPCVDHRSFDPFLDELPDNIRVLLWDMRGHGNSEGNDQRVTMELLVEDLLDILAHAGIEKAVFIGQSLGGAIVQKVAKRRPEMVLGMGLLGVACLSSRATFFEIGASAVMRQILKRFSLERMARNTSRSYSVTARGREYVQKCVLKMDKKDVLEVVGISVDWMEKDKNYKTDIPAYVAIGSWDALSMTDRTFAVYRKVMPKAELYKATGGAALLQFDLPKQVLELTEKLLSRIAEGEKGQPDL